MVSGRSFPLIDKLPRESRRLIGSFTSLSVNPSQVNESIIAPEKAVKKSLRRKPPSSWNPIQNNLHP